MIEKLTCSECGRKFEKPTLLQSYQYKVKLGASTLFQCGYTCYDHVKLRVSSDKKDLSDYNNLVKRCEQMMKSQGKEIIYPIQPRTRKVIAKKKGKK